ncbi:MAG TPA: AAA family ATPase [Flavobacteriaceae bacterium]|nr:AAA family ATPase [Flavobacteriaceae bacterium]
MKILKIEFRNINSLKGTHEIDFTKSPFTQGSLFAITGPTGSGKSSVLDVISLALFNRIPRLTKVSKEEIAKTGAIVTRNQKEALAAVTYEGKSGRFRSEWSISTARTGNMREYKMQLSEADSGQLLDLKKSEVPKKNEELIGLNYDQFIKAVLLAQGDFARFLKAPKSERGELLEKITGTGIYRQLGKRCYEKFKEENRAIENQQQHIQVLREQLLEEEQEKKLTEDLRQKECDAKKLESKIDTLNKKLELKQKIGAKEKETTEQFEQKSKAENELKIFDSEHGFPLKQHEKVEDQAENIRNWRQWKKDLTNLKTDRKSCSDSKAQTLADQKECLLQAENLIGTTISSENILEKLSDFGKKVSSLQQEKKEKFQEYTSIKTQLDRQLKGIKFQLNEKNLKESQNDLFSFQKNSEEKVAAFQLDLKELDLENSEKEKEVLINRLELAREAWRKDDEILKITENIDRALSEEKELLPKLETFPERIEKAKTQSELFQTKLDKFQLQRENQLLQASLEEHRHALKNGEPCPLCGALEHPFAENLPEKSDSLETEIATNRKKLDEWKNKLSTARADLKLTREHLEKVRKQSQILQNELNNQKNVFSEKYGHLCSGTKKPNWENMCHNWQQQIQKIQQYQEEQERLKAVLIGISLLNELRKIMSEGKKLKSDLEAIYTGSDIHNDLSKISSQWIRLEQEQKNSEQRLLELDRKITSKSTETENLERELLPFVTEHGFENLEQAAKALMPESECRSLRTARENLQTKITGATSSLHLLQSQLVALKKEDNPETATALQDTLKETKDKSENLSGECKELFRLLKNHAANLERLNHLQSEISQKEKQIRKWRLLNELIGDATGKKFNDFAQDLSLNQLLQLANIRLNDLSDRYRIDKPKNDEDDGLTAIDKDMGGQRRSVKTLSGGETFILSLSMALALSDLASKNVEINSLFIDEGFGTLDHETLDQTLDTLERLQAESSKTIGIISHVDSLKERITTQIRLKRNGQGYSSLEISDL